jgi:hypothetical protein
MSDAKLSSNAVHVSLNSLTEIHKLVLHASATVSASHSDTAYPPSNLLKTEETPESKWFAPGVDQAWVEIEFAEQLDFRGVGFKSAGDRPELAPTDVKISMRHPLDMGWIEIAKRSLDFENQP